MHDVKAMYIKKSLYTLPADLIQFSLVLFHKYELEKIKYSIFLMRIFVHVVLRTKLKL